MFLFPLPTHSPHFLLPVTFGMADLNTLCFTGWRCVFAFELGVYHLVPGGAEWLKRQLCVAEERDRSLEWEEAA